ncbi:hypothetical protein PVAP13_3KG261859 [Panicum virgatum]|uniref:GDSL esterase/lipase n=1 Tax=Panicum virgatum TaxID=38727 RepID=A0A8T0UZX1_PANVG|nr:hypothetical protein PVAP13_3KG261859 [Panicum virgatum]
MRLSVVLLVVALLCLGGGGGRLVAASTDFNFPAVFNFGDSNSDTGGRVAAGFESILPPYGSTFFGGPAGRFCDGRLILDFLMEAMDMPLNNNNNNNNNIAFFPKQVGLGVQSHQQNQHLSARFHLVFRLSNPLPSRTKLLSSCLKEICTGDTFLRKITFQKDSTCLILGKMILLVNSIKKTEDQVIASIPTILLEFETGLKKLYDQGARKFWIHNTGPLGCLPQNIALFGKDPSQLDELHCVAKHNRAAKLFNLQLHALCTKLRGEFAGASITYVDIHTIKYNLIANYSRFGFEHATQACCGYGGPPLNYDGNVPCGQTVSLNGKLVTAKGCSDTTEFVNWDGIHYTEAANFHIASQILTGKY